MHCRTSNTEASGSAPTSCWVRTGHGALRGQTNGLGRSWGAGARVPLSPWPGRTPDMVTRGRRATMLCVQQLGFSPSQHSTLRMAVCLLSLRPPLRPPS